MRMFSSVLFRRIFFSICIVSLGSFLILYYFCADLMRRSAYEAQIQSIHNRLENAERLVSSLHLDMERFRSAAINDEREEIRSVTLVQEYFLKSQYEEFQRGLFPTEAEAKQHTLSFLSEQRYGDDQYFWVADHDSALICHPELYGEDLSDFRDAEGNRIMPPLVQGAMEKGEIYYSYRLPAPDGQPPLERVAYGRWFPQWQWVIGTGFDMETIEKKVRERKDELIEELRGRLTGGEPGLPADIYVLDSDLGTIAASSSTGTAPDFSEILNSLAQNPEKGMSAAVSRQNESPLDSSSQDEDIQPVEDRGTMLWIRHVPELNWHLVASVNEKLLRESVRSITGNIALIGGLLFCVFLLLVGLIVGHFLTPIQNLASIAAEFVQKGEVADNRYLVDKGEIGILGAALYKMAGAVDAARRELKSREQQHQAVIRSGERARGRAYDMTKAKERIEQDIQDYKRREASLRKSEERYRAMLENIEEYFYEVDLLGNLIFFNDALFKMLGYTKEELVGKNFRDLTDKETAEKAFRTFKQAYETGRPEKGFEWKLIRKDGSRCFVEISVSLIRDADGEVMGFRGVARDVSELLYLVYHDSLTGLYNRKAFFERLKETLAFARRDKNEKHIFYMDLDKFKKVNDVYGHDVGDGVLVEVAARLKATLRETDHVCRLGGDEFTIILNNVTDSRPEEAAQRIIDALSMPYEVKDQTIDFITPSIGISTFPKDADDTETLIWCADIAMFEAKRKGGEYAFYTEEMGSRYSESKKITR